MAYHCTKYWAFVNFSTFWMPRILICADLGGKTPKKAIISFSVHLQCKAQINVKHSIAIWLWFWNISFIFVHVDWICRAGVTRNSVLVHIRSLYVPIDQSVADKKCHKPLLHFIASLYWCELLDTCTSFRTNVSQADVRYLREPLHSRSLVVLAEQTYIIVTDQNTSFQMRVGILWSMCLKKHYSIR